MKIILLTVVLLLTGCNQAFLNAMSRMNRDFQEDSYRAQARYNENMQTYHLNSISNSLNDPFRY